MPTPSSVLALGEAHAGELHRWPVSQPRVASIIDLKSLAIQIVDNLNAFLNYARGGSLSLFDAVCCVDDTNKITGAKIPG